ncbi:amidase [Pseudonocardia endophytica]|uniref:Aspartyl-tRNA(Asn)/glutamyl-tRNA(Gln) amidotransferase subunit A n=1 Tax=Pseudonocardia endophytica TaxID=401976 RepID=A0A4R1HNY7_PSEEN|nr:amidase family protein [Pseudonocardia endophytica]TCK22100.1 aspartyl-tRNA(Asn)/glutamyl-tRNA(Gln) amidotransferase subunit A [Pseudonocardia endophytica]
MTTSDELCWIPAAELAKRIRAGDVTPTDVAEQVVARIDAVNPELNAFINFDREQVLHDARRLTEHQHRGGELGPLHGVPYSIKDLTAVAGLPLTFGLEPLKDNIASRDAAVVTRLRAAGGLFLGITNTIESGYHCGSTDNHLFGATHNPWRHDLIAGGSSGGAAAAAAAGLGQLHEGSDGAGSVRSPASLCGVVGMKPTGGRIPQSILPGRYNSWVHHGPITRTVTDNALMLNVLAGPDPSDPTSLPTEHLDYVTELDNDITGWRIAYSPDLDYAHVDSEVAGICRTAVSAFEELGAHVTEATPHWGNPVDAMWDGIWVPGIGSAYDLVDWEAQRGHVDDNLIELMHENERLSGVDVGRADVFRGAMWDTFSAFMNDYELLVTPTLADPAFPLTQFAPDRLLGTPLRRQALEWVLTFPFNMMTTPAISVPAGFTSDGRPVGLQITGRMHADSAVLCAAAHFERARPWAPHRP